MPTCRTCKKDMHVDNFKLKNGIPLKGCAECNEKCRLNRLKNLCPHKRQKSQCKDCKGSSICSHDIIKSNCVKCKGSQICIHKRTKKTCKQCNGSQVCLHGKQKSQCKGCDGGGVCKHDKLRTRCKICGGGSYCSHGKLKSVCKDCGGSQICIHGIERRRCIPCDGSEVCKHKRLQHRCKICKGRDICKHNKQKSSCHECDPLNAFKLRVSNTIRRHLKNKKANKTIEYLGCTIPVYKKFIERQFDEGMSWSNYGEWEIDHIVPVNYNKPTLEIVQSRLHYTNTQPLWKSENMAKGNRYIIGVMYRYSNDLYKQFNDCLQL